jgi:ABC-2 type transport system permease protein
MGATPWEVVRNWRGLWLLAGVYFILAVISAHLIKRRHANG